MLRRKLTLPILASTLVAVQASGRADETIDYAMHARIRQEARQHSHIMRTLHFLSDVYGPRLTGSPNHKAAAEWALKQLQEWGLENAHLEPWEFGHPGWLNERASGFIVSPVKDSLVLEVLAWTPSTKGTVSAQTVQIVPPQCTPASASTRPGTPEGPTPGPPVEPSPPGPAVEATPAAGPAAPRGSGGAAAQRCPTQEELTAYLESVKSRVAGKVVLVGAHTAVRVSFNPPPLRRDEEQLRQQVDPSNPDASVFQGPRGRGNQPQPGRLTPNQITEQVDTFLLANRAVVRVNDAGRDHGQIRAFHNRTYDPAKTVPTVILRNEDYGRISRLLADGTPVELEFTIENRVFPEGRTSYNAVAEIRGTDKPDEVVMLGGHLDSWHAATGATDNAIGCAVMMEAVRILKALGVEPRRTIRIALWSGEEQGLLGSKAYVKEHFGTAEAPKPAFETLSGYFNLDSGTGRIRIASIFGPPEAAAVLREAFAPFEDLGVVGASATRSRRSGGTDSTSFNEAGLPGIGLGQDPIQYQTHTWHTNLDTYERIVAEDVKRSAIAIAGAVYHVAMREERLPRFTREEMPPPAAAPKPAPSTTTSPSSASR
jgi:carboxypeptidase Q